MTSIQRRAGAGSAVRLQSPTRSLLRERGASQALGPPRLGFVLCMLPAAYCGRASEGSGRGGADPCVESRSLGAWGVSTGRWRPLSRGPPPSREGSRTGERDLPLCELRPRAWAHRGVLEHKQRRLGSMVGRTFSILPHSPAETVARTVCGVVTRKGSRSSKYTVPRRVGCSGPSERHLPHLWRA